MSAAAKALDALEAAGKAAIPCPGAWRWEVNAKSKTVTLGTRSWEAMGFARWGMSGAQPVFPERQDAALTILRPASEMIRPIHGREHHQDWAQVIDNPNAELIVASVNLSTPLAAVARAAMAISKRFPRTGAKYISAAFDTDIKRLQSALDALEAAAAQGGAS